MMTTEHRYHARHSSDIQVHIQYRRRRFISALGRDVSEHGMYLRVRNLTLPKGTQVTLDFHEGGRDWLIPAVVVHQETSGIGVLFQAPQPELLERLMLRDLSGALMSQPESYSGLLAGA